MDLYGRSPAMEGPHPNPDTGLDGGGNPPYPERPGEPECTYYMHTGSCSYGDKCRYNHPRNHDTVARAARTGAMEYPERVGQPVCQYFLKTGVCKYGITCKYHHPRQGGGSVSPVSLNYYGYPLRLGEKECSYYVKTGSCKFGSICKFHHPQPAGTTTPSPVPAFYPMVPSPSVTLPHQYPPMASWQIARPSILPGSYINGPYGPMLVSPAVVPFPSWSSYPPPGSPVVSHGGQHTVQAGSLYGLVNQLSPSTPAYPGPYPPILSLAGPSGSSQKENMFPERPGKPECHHYMRTGDCKFRSMCRYHHSPGWSTPKKNRVLSPIHLPLRPGALPCTYYAQNGVCKFGSACKFDHPVGRLSYTPSASSLSDMPVAPCPVGFSIATLTSSLSSSELRT